MNEREIEDLIESHKKVLLEINKKRDKKDKIRKLKGTQHFVQLEKKLLNEFQQFSKEVHKFILPLSKNDFEKIVAEKQSNKVTYDSENNLSSNTCLAPNCKFYGTFIKRIHHHLDTLGGYPRGFHEFVKKHSSQETEKIYQDFLEAQKVPKDQTEYYGYTMEDIKKYISMVKEAYAKMQ